MEEVDVSIPYYWCEWCPVRRKSHSYNKIMQTVATAEEGMEDVSSVKSITSCADMISWELHLKMNSSYVTDGGYGGYGGCKYLSLSLLRLAQLSSRRLLSEVAPCPESNQLISHTPWYSTVFTFNPNITQHSTSLKMEVMDGMEATVVVSVGLVTEQHKIGFDLLLFCFLGLEVLTSIWYKYKRLWRLQ